MIHSLLVLFLSFPSMAATSPSSPTSPKFSGTPVVSSSSDASSSLSHTSFNISHHFHTPMDWNSYLCCRSQFQDVLAIHDLKHIISANASPPAATLCSGVENPEFTLWVKTDRLVLSWIEAMASSTIQTMLLPYTSA